MSNNIPEGLSEEMVAALVANPGQTITPQDLKPQTFTPTQSIGLRNETKDIRPNIKGNRPNDDGLIGGPSSKFADGLAQKAQQDAKAALRELENQQKQTELLSNQSLRRDVEFLRRQVTKMQKQIKELTNA